MDRDVNNVKSGKVIDKQGQDIALVTLLHRFPTCVIKYRSFQDCLLLF